ncbi:MAG: hypothetical protein NTV34_20530, partial [Proteobacteria bacterium]|nr:hypothetical protein [Pseudomonadota bacterium]
MLSELNLKLFEKCGLDIRAIQEHRRNIEAFFADGFAPKFKIIDTCRLDNGGIRKPLSSDVSDSFSDIISFVPAAGASSRWLSPLSELSSALADGD